MEAESHLQDADSVMIIIKTNDRHMEILYDFGNEDDHIAMLNHALFYIVSGQVYYE